MNIVKPVGRFLKRSAPTILCIAASGGVIVSNLLTAKAVLKADEVLKQPRDENTKKKLIGIYIPPVTAAAATITCIVGAHLMNKKIRAGLIAAYGIVDSTYRAYRAKVITEEGTEKDISIRHEINQDRLNEIVVENATPPAYIQNRRSDEALKLWIDNYSPEPYWATENDILKGITEVNRQISDWNNGKGYASLRDIYQFTIGNESNDNADIYGWTWEYMDQEWSCTWIDYHWTDNYTIKGKNGEDIQCNYIEFFCPPIPGFLDYDPEPKSNSRKKPTLL